MKTAQPAASNAATRMMAPYKCVPKTPVRSMVYLVIGILILLFDLVFSGRLIFAISGTYMKIGMIALSGISVLRDVSAAKRGFSRGAKDILGRLAAIASAVFLSIAAVRVGAQSGLDWLTDVLLLAVSLTRLSSPRKSYHRLILFSVIAAVIAFAAAGLIPGGAEGARFAAEALTKQIAPFIATAIGMIKKGWALL